MRVTASRRLYQRDYARRTRERRFAAERLTADRCPKRWGKHPCGGPLHTTTDRIGRTLVLCAWCERHALGLCLECPQPVIGKAKRCPACQVIERARAVARYRARHHDRVCAREREFYMRPAVRAARNEYKRAWRKLHPEKVRAQKRRAALRQPQHVLDYMRRYRARYREHYRSLELARYYRLHPVRPDPHCVRCGEPIAWAGRGNPPKRCDRCVPRCILRLREAGRERRRLAVAGAPERPRVLRTPRRPRTTYILGDGTHRCCGAGCRALLEGRVKKCASCKARARYAAAESMAILARRVAA